MVEIKVHGMKTYVTAMGMIMYAVGGLVAGQLDLNTAVNAIFIGLGMMGLRHGIESKFRGIIDVIKPKEPELNAIKMDK